MKDEGFIVLGRNEGGLDDRPVTIHGMITPETKIGDLTVAQFMALLKQATDITVLDVERAVDRVKRYSRL